MPDNEMFYPSDTQPTDIGALFGGDIVEEPPPKRPSPAMLERATKVLNERFKASKRIVNAKKDKWKIWERMYKNEQIQRRIIGESNLVLPKADYIAEVISAKVINSIFSVSEWLTMKHPMMDPAILADQQTWLMWVMDRKVNFYLTAIELFKSAPIKGTAICKVYMKHFWPCVEYLDLESFFPDPLARKPGDIQSMRYCFHQFKRDMNQIKRFVNANNQSIYTNLDKLEEMGKAKLGESFRMTGTEGVSVEDKIVPIFDLIEYHGEFEHTKGQYGEYIITGVLKEQSSDEIDLVIRCEPSGFKVMDNYTQEETYLKPFVSSIYSVNPGEFYGKSAISSVESLINEQTDLHNLYMDNHKRLVNGITKVLNRTNLTRNDIPQVPGAIWFLDSFEDVEVETPPETNLIGYKTIHELLDRELEKASGVTSYNLGVGRTKRETYGEIRSMISEASDRFQLFIQMADRLTLRPLLARVYPLLRQTFSIFKNMDFNINGQQIGISEENLLEDMDVSFAATTIESEHSKYSKQQTFPQIVTMLANISGGRLNVDEVAREIGNLYNYRNAVRFLNPEDQIPISALPPELQPIAQQILAAMQGTQNKRSSNPQIPAPQPLGSGMGTGEM
jgi:hypothetical protein